MGSNRISIYFATVVVILSISLRITNATVIAETQNQWPKPFGSPCRPEDFRVYWQVDSEFCHKYRLDFLGLNEQFGIIQNNGDKRNGEEVRSFLLSPSSPGLDFFIGKTPVDFSGYGIMIQNYCKHYEFGNDFVNRMATIKQQRPNGTWTLGNMPCDPDHFNELAAFQGIESIISPGIYNPHLGAVEHASKYLDDLKKAIVENNITARIIPNVVMHYEELPTQEWGVGYDYLKAFTDRGFCEVTITSFQRSIKLVHTRDQWKCRNIHEFVHQILGPAILRLRAELSGAEMTTAVPTVSTESTTEDYDFLRVIPLSPK